MARLVGKDYRTFDLLLTFLAAFTDRATGMEEKGPMAMVHSMYSELLLLVSKDGSRKTSWQRFVLIPECAIASFKNFVSEVCEAHCNTG